MVHGGRVFSINWLLYENAIYTQTKYLDSSLLFRLVVLRVPDPTSALHNIFVSDFSDFRNSNTTNVITLVDTLRVIAVPPVLCRNSGIEQDKLEGLAISSNEPPPQI